MDKNFFGLWELLSHTELCWAAETWKAACLEVSITEAWRICACSLVQSALCPQGSAVQPSFCQDACPGSLSPSFCDWVSGWGFFSGFVPALQSALRLVLYLSVFVLFFKPWAWLLLGVNLDKRYKCWEVLSLQQQQIQIMTDLVGAVSQQGSGLKVSPVCLPGPAWGCTTHGSWEAPGTHMLLPFL